MMRGPRGLSPGEWAAWARVAGTVRPLAGKACVPAPENDLAAPNDAARPSPDAGRGQAIPLPSRPAPVPAPRGRGDVLRHGLDASWERRLRKGEVGPDAMLDLHGLSLAAAHARLERGLGQARAARARLVLLVTGRARPADPADRAVSRGAIRAQVLDWLAAGPHAAAIAAIRPAHRRHGGPGALYIVLRRKR